LSCTAISSSIAPLFALSLLLLSPLVHDGKQ
jgi:hypothetical protein